MNERRFPVIRSYRREERLEQEKHGCPDSVPWSFVAAHEEQAQRNHGQTLEKLAFRGGLDPAEMIALIEDRRFSRMSIADAARKLAEMVREHERKLENAPIFVDEGVICTKCGESVPPGSLLPCRCKREAPFT